LQQKQILIVSAFPLTKTQIKNIKNILTKTHEINIKTKIKTTLIGGFIIKIDDIFLDFSLKEQLKKLSKKIIS
jgi:F-type H+-transporting ATPase subunit delta